MIHIKSKIFQNSLLRTVVRQLTQYSKNNQIYLHKNGMAYGASFSKDPKAVPIGYSPTESIEAPTFQGNSKFLAILHDQMSKKIHHDFTFIMEAGVNALTFMPIYDFREIPRFSRTPNVDDVFGYVLVDSEGKIVPDSYQPNDLYRLCNSSGMIKLSDYMLEEIRSATED